MAYNKLRFFDSESNDLNLLYNSDNELWEGVCYLPKVSVGLYETLTIYILEEVQGTLGNTKYVMPISEKTGGSKFKFKFFSGYEYSEDIFMYDAINVDGRLEIQKKDEVTFDLLDSNLSTSVNRNGFKVINSTVLMTPLKCNIALMSHVDNYHTRLLDIIEIDDAGNEVIIATIRIYGETEEEDERLAVLLSNIGMTLKPEDYVILKDSDVKELSPNWILMNQKRKELLLQASQIKPFIGTYKALLNAIDFFGYDKITLKEYWLNINEQSENFGKLKAIAVPNQEVTGFLADKNKENELPSSNLKKTSRFSLVYRLNDADGNVDEWDIPTVQESLDYSPDEVLIKLYGLKNKLQKEFLPLQAKIVDITGEGDYFSQFNLNVWNNQHSIKVQNAGQNVDFSRFPKERQLFIEDLRKVDYRLTGIFQDFNFLTDTDREEITESIQNFYNGYYNEDLSTFNTLAGIPIGCPVVLNAESFIDSWDSAEFTWLDAGKEYTGGFVGYNFYDDFPALPSNPSLNYYDYLKANEPYNLLTWNNWWKQGIYEMEWTVSGPNGYLKTFRGGIGYTDNAGVFHPEYQQFPIVLPFTGSYSVELAVYDLYNIRSSWREENYFEVKNKNVEVYGLFQKIFPKLNWNQYKYDFNVAGGDWDSGSENTSDVDSIIATYYLTLDRANYVHDGDDGAEFSTVRRFLDSTQPTGYSETPGPYQWKELRTHTWNDGAELNWDMMRVGADINSSFKIDLRNSEGYVNGHKLFIKQLDPVKNIEITDSYEITSPYPVDNTDILAWNLIADELRNLNKTEHPLFAKFNFNPVLIDVDVNGTNDVCNYMLIVAEEPSRTHDYSEVGFNNVAGGIIVPGSEVHFVSYNPNFNDLCIVDTHMEVNMLNHVTFSYDNSKMPGIVSQNWRLKNNSQNVDDIYYSNTWLTYLFKHKGDYTIELELTDVNGNKNKINKNILKII